MYLEHSRKMYYFKIELLLPKYKLRNSAYLSIKADWKEWSVYEPKKKKRKDEPQ